MAIDLNNYKLSNQFEQPVEEQPKQSFLKKTAGVLSGIGSALTQSEQNLGEDIGRGLLGGDKFQQGRSNTYLRHSFSPLNKEGVLELGLKEKRKYILSSNSISIGPTKTKTIHFLGAITGVTSSVSGVVNSNKYIISNISEEIYNISTLNDSEKTVYRQILGEKNTSLLNNIIDILKIVNSSINNLKELILNHNHTISKTDLRSIFNIRRLPASLAVRFSIPDKNSSRAISINTAVLDHRINLINRVINNLDRNIGNQLSKHQFIN